MQMEMKLALPRVSLWLTGLKETMAQLPAFVKVAHDIGVNEVYLQRLVYFQDGQGLARPESALFEQLSADESRLIREAEEVAANLGIRFNASGATEPGASLKRKDFNATLGLVPPALDADVFQHRRAPSVLHRAVFHARL